MQPAIEMSERPGTAPSRPEPAEPAIAEETSFSNPAAKDEEEGEMRRVKSPIAWGEPEHGTDGTVPDGIDLSLIHI